MFQVDPRGILAVVAILMCWALAVVLFRVSPPGSMARKLSLLLVLEGVTLGTSDVISYFLVSPESFFQQYSWLDMTLTVAHVLGDLGMFALYPVFLAAALQTRLTRPFARKRVRTALWGFSILLFPAVFLTPQEIGVTVLYLSLTLVFGFALAAAIQAWWNATGSARSRALIFVLAFGFRDLCWGYIYAMGIWEIWTGADPLTTGSADFSYIVYVLGTLVAVPLIAYGILRTQLFDIDLRLRWTIKQSTLAGIFVSLMFLISEGASEFLSAELGSVSGLLAAAVVMFFLAPLQRFSERVAGAAMPNTKNTPEYAMYRKLQVYESAVAEAQLEGGISHKERALLVVLRDSLGISPADAESLEMELQTGVASTA